MNKTMDTKKGTISVFVLISLLAASFLLLYLPIHFKKGDVLPLIENRIIQVSWNEVSYTPQYKGVIFLEKKALGNINKDITGLTFHPDGRIAYSSAGKTITDDPIISFWNDQAPEEPIINLQYHQPDDESSKNPEMFESKGLFSAFAGPIAYNNEGSLFFSLGPFAGDAIHKVISNDPIAINKLYDIEYGTSMQIPYFDLNNIYITAFNGIKKYPSSDYLREPNEKYWFKMKGNDASINNAFIIDEDKILLTVFGYTYASYNHKNKDKQKRDYEIKTFLFDKSRQSFWLVDNVALGVVAVSQDQEVRRVIYNDKSDQKLYELFIQKNL